MFTVSGYNDNGCGTWLRFMQKMKQLSDYVQ